MNDARVFEEFSGAVQTAQNEVAFAGAAERLSQTMGFRWFTYLGLGGVAPAVLSTYPAIWSDHYLANRFEEIDPVVELAQRRRSPFFWGALGQGARPSDPSGARLFDDAASFGIVGGLTIPFRASNDRTSLLTFSTPEASPTLMRQADVLRTFLQTCGLLLHNEISSRLPRFMPERRKQALTRRQKVCLAAAAEGQSAKEAARLIGTAPRTIEEHWVEARKRLQAKNISHAVAIAVREKVIS